MATLFTKIINGDIPSYKIAEDEKHFAFLDINPLAKGHTLVVPKKEIDYIYDLKDDELADLNVFAKKVGKAIESVISCKRIGIAVVGLEVPHVHIHLIPISQVSDINFTKPKIELSEQEVQNISAEIRTSYEQLYD